MRQDSTGGGSGGGEAAEEEARLAGLLVGKPKKPRKVRTDTH